MGAQASHTENLCAEETAPVPPLSLMTDGEEPRDQSPAMCQSQDPGV